MQLKQNLLELWSKRHQIERYSPFHQDVNFEQETDHLLLITPMSILDLQDCWKKPNRKCYWPCASCTNSIWLNATASIFSQMQWLLVSIFTIFCGVQETWMVDATDFCNSIISIWPHRCCNNFDQAQLDFTPELQLWTLFYSKLRWHNPIHYFRKRPVQFRSAKRNHSTPAECKNPHSPECIERKFTGLRCYDEELTRRWPLILDKRP